MLAIGGDAFGHGDVVHEDTLDHVQAIERARHWLGVLIDRGKLGSEWSGLAPERVRRTGTVSEEEWTATFRDPDPAAAGGGFVISMDLNGAYLGSVFVDADGNRVSSRQPSRPRSTPPDQDENES